MQTIGPEDYNWLFEVHGISVKEDNVVFIYGTEDCPDRVEVHKSDCIDASYAVWERIDFDQDGCSVCGYQKVC